MLNFEYYGTILYDSLPEYRVRKLKLVTFGSDS